MTNNLTLKEENHSLSFPSLTQEDILAYAKAIEKDVKSLIRKIAHQKGWPDYGCVEDTYQEAVIRAIKAKHAYDQRRPFQNWFSRIAINCLIDHIKRDTKNNCSPSSLWAGSEKDLDNIAFHSGGTKFSSEAQIINHIENRLTIEKAIKILECLPITLREPLFRSEFNGDSHDEIASDLGISKQALRVRISRAKKLIRQYAGDSMG